MIWVFKTNSWLNTGNNQSLGPWTGLYFYWLGSTGNTFKTTVRRGLSATVPDLQALNATYRENSKGKLPSPGSGKGVLPLVLQSPLLDQPGRGAAGKSPQLDPQTRHSLVGEEVEYTASLLPSQTKWESVQVFILVRKFLLQEKSSRLKDLSPGRGMFPLGETEWPHVHALYTCHFY